MIKHSLLIKFSLVVQQTIAWAMQHKILIVTKTAMVVQL